MEKRLSKLKEKIEDPRILDEWDKFDRMLIKILEELSEKEKDIIYLHLVMDEWKIKESAIEISRVLCPENITILLMLFSKPCYTRELCRVLKMSRSDISRNLNTLMKLGLVYRVRGNEGIYKRYVYNFLTAKGIRFVRNLLLFLEPCLKR